MVVIKKDEVIAYFIKEANKQLLTPVDVAKIDLSIWSQFPRVSVELRGITVIESVVDQKGVLANAERLSFLFDPIELIKQNFQIDVVRIKNAEINLLVNAAGEINYKLLGTAKSGESTLFEITQIELENVQVSYLNERSEVEVHTLINNGKAKLKSAGGRLETSAEAELISEGIGVSGKNYMAQKPLHIKTKLISNIGEKKYDFEDTYITINEGRFQVSGNLDVANRAIDLKFDGVNTDIQTITSLLPQEYLNYLEKYKSRGELFFEGTINGGYGDKTSPLINLDFGAKDATIYHPGYNKRLTELNLNGNFNNGSSRSSRDYKLRIADFYCVLDKKELSGKLSIENFERYTTELRLKGEADINSVLTLFPGKITKTAYGSLDLDFELAGDLKKSGNKKGISTQGEVGLKNISMVFEGERLPLNRINGNLTFRGNDLAVSDLSGYVGRSDFLLNGFIKDFGAMILDKNNPITLQADLIAGYMDFDELLKSNFASRDTSYNKGKEYEFKISPDIFLDFNCSVDHVKFDRFHARKVKGNLNIHNQIAILNNIGFSSLGGRVNISGSVNSKNPALIETVAEANLYNISIDSMFYVFRNFKQEWLTDRNLKGQIDADVNLYMNLNSNLELNKKSLTADISTSIFNGELNDFEPMMKLSKYVEEKSLANTRFSRIRNNVRIEDGIIYIPEMEIRSNVSSILISGQHTFDKEIDYRLKVPLKNLIRFTKKHDFQVNSRRGVNLLLKIEGTTSDYKISYDSQTLKDNIKSDILDEGEEWRNIRKTSTSAEEQVPELEEEYFDFDEETPDNR